ncbi:MAG TPA: valine--tRNA ligase [Candidatus Thermoplasmatota archaeon]|nr:valine--tRNA ligase [Candidatus Thermoplasmatota archaeon]
MPEEEETVQSDPALQAMEEKWLRFWNEENLYAYDPKSKAPVFSIDTPPPTVSGKMHIGHAYSYSQMDFIARYKRMRGFNLFYPWGFDDNGLPTERYTERETGVKITDVGRKEFIRLCLEKTREAEASMEKSWRRIGQSCDFGLTYQTIGPHAVKTSQLSFVELYKADRAYRAERPSIWCPECATAIAQVEAEDKELPSTFNDIPFELVGEAAPGRLVHDTKNEETGELTRSYQQGAEGKIVISTTRPELIGACVAIFTHPDDARTKHLHGRKVRVPLYGHEVPILTSDKVDQEKGTGMVMNCTFGDLTDIDWWQANNLPLRIAINEHGKMTPLAGKYQGMTVTEAREAILKDLQAGSLLLHQKAITHNVNVHERCGTPIEFLVTKQWFIRYLDLKDDFLRMGAEIKWHPEHMKVRYDNWVKGLKWDWCISRQRFFGVAFPVWYCKGCGHTHVAEAEELPVDPMEQTPQKPCAKCGGRDWTPEKDVMDTWATSSLTPQIALQWAEDSPLMDKAFPMSLRAQAHEIISFWAFNTIVKSHFHQDSIPWKDIMISGFVKLGKGKKMSKSKGNIVEPLDVIRDYSGDALRYWSATGASLGEDIIWNPKELTRAMRLATKIRNIEKFIGMCLGGEKPKAVKASELRDVDAWILTEYARLVKSTTQAWDDYDYLKALRETENFVWHVLADHYLELVKHRARDPNDHAVRYTLYTVGLGIAKLFAPVLCFSMEDVYQETYRALEGKKSIHVAPWPEAPAEDTAAWTRGELAKDVVAAARNWKSQSGVGIGNEIPTIEVVATPEAQAALKRSEADIAATLRTAGLHFVDAKDLTLVPVAVKPNFAVIGPKYKAQGRLVGEALKGMDAAKATPGGMTITLPDGNQLKLDAEDYSVETRPVLHGVQVEQVHVGNSVTLLLRGK